MRARPGSATTRAAPDATAPESLKLVPVGTAPTARPPRAKKGLDSRCLLNNGSRIRTCDLSPETRCFVVYGHLADHRWSLAPVEDGLPDTGGLCGEPKTSTDSGRQGNLLEVGAQLIIAATARKHGVSDEDIRHA